MSNKNISIKKVSTSINNSYFFGRKFPHNSTSGAEMILAGFSRYIYIYALKKVLTMQFLTFNCKRIEFYWLSCKNCSFWLAVTNHAKSQEISKFKIGVFEWVHVNDPQAMRAYVEKS